MLACHVVFSMLLGACPGGSTCAAEVLVYNGASPPCGWVGLVLKLCVGWREKRASSIACLAPTGVLMPYRANKYNALFDACSLLRIVKLWPEICHTHLVHPHALKNNTV